MTARVQIVDGEFRVVLTPEMAAALHLTDGAEVEVRPLPEGSRDRPAISVGEARASFLRTEPRHRETYRALAKGSSGSSPLKR